MNGINPELVIDYSNKKLKYFGIPKLVFAHKMYGFPYLDIKGEYGISNRDNYIIIKDDIEDLIKDISGLITEATKIDKTLFDEYNVKRGLRNPDGSGVLVGLTNVGDVVGYVKEPDGVKPVEGNLRYRGYPVTQLVKGFQADKRPGFDESTFLLLTGKLPTKAQLNNFSEYF